MPSCKNRWYNRENGQRMEKTLRYFKKNPIENMLAIVDKSSYKMNTRTKGKI